MYRSTWPGFVLVGASVTAQRWMRRCRLKLSGLVSSMVMSRLILNVKFGLSILSISLWILLCVLGGASVKSLISCVG